MYISKNLHASSKIRKFPKFLHPALFLLREFLTRIFYYFKIQNQTKRFDGIETCHNLPFLTENFLKCYNHTETKIGEETTLPKNRIYYRCHQLCYLLEQTSEIKGDIIELGVAKGFQFLFAKNFLKEKLNKKVYLVDTFSPNAIDPITGAQDNPELLSQGIKLGYAKSFINTKKNFEEFEQFNFVKGKVPEILNNISLDRLSFIHMDLNHPNVEYQAYEYLWDKLSTGGMILSDDFAYIGHDNQMNKTIEFFKTKKHQILTLATGQGLIIKK
jgi:hypothetical protein